MRFVVDSGVVLELSKGEIKVSANHELLAPTLVRSETLSALHEEVHAGKLDRDVALVRLGRIREMPLRLPAMPPCAVARGRSRIGWAGPTRTRRSTSR